MSQMKMRPIRDTIPLGEALAVIIDTATPLERTSRVMLADAAGRVLASTMTATQDVPPFDRAAMDGYAVIAEDTFGASRHEPRALQRVETVHTGSVPTRPLARGECTEIATGAPMPHGGDAVVMVEETAEARTTRRGQRGPIFTPVYPRQHVGRRGADISASQVVLETGDMLTPGRLGAIAALGLADVDVFDQPTVAILSTGNEIIEPGTPLGPGQIYDINRFTLGAVIGRARVLR